MKTVSLKIAAGLALSLAAFSPKGMAEVKPAYRNMNIPILSCQISEESRKNAAEAGLTALEKLDVVADYEAAFMLNEGMISQSQAMIVYSAAKVDSFTGTALNSVSTGTLRKDSKAGWTFTSDEIRYNEKYVGRETIVISTKEKTATVTMQNKGDSSLNSSKIYNCNSGMMK